MQEDGPRLDVDVADGIIDVELLDRKILDEVEITQIGEQLGALVAQNDKPKMIISFGNVGHMSSSALGMLITLHKRVSEKQGQLRLCNIQPTIYEVFVITRLNEIFKICASRSEAAESLS